MLDNMSLELKSVPTGPRIWITLIKMWDTCLSTLGSCSQGICSADLVHNNSLEVIDPGSWVGLQKTLFISRCQSPYTRTWCEYWWKKWGSFTGLLVETLVSGEIFGVENEHLKCHGSFLERCSMIKGEIEDLYVPWSLIGSAVAVLQLLYRSL